MNQSFNSLRQARRLVAFERCHRLFQRQIQSMEQVLRAVRALTAAGIGLWVRLGLWALVRFSGLGDLGL